jgi:hypothetical protein
VLVCLVKVFLHDKPPLVPPTLLSATAKAEVYHPLLALYGVLYELRRIRMLLLRVAVLLVLVVAIRSSNEGGMSPARMIVKETKAKAIKDRPDLKLTPSMLNS